MCLNKIMHMGKGRGFWVQARVVFSYAGMRVRGMVIAFPYPYLAYLMVRVFSFITHGYLFFPNPYPNRVFTRRVRGLRVPIAMFRRSRRGHRYDDKDTISGHALKFSIIIQQTIHRIDYEKEIHCTITLEI